MDGTISVSKGCFVFKNGATRANKAVKSPKRKRAAAETPTGILGKEVTEQPFYKVYGNNWRSFYSHIETLQRASYSRTLTDLLDYVTHEYDGHMTTSDMPEILPTAALLTGINQPDHLNQFDAFEQRLHEQKIGASVCVLQSRDCGTLKAAIEALVYGFIEASTLFGSGGEDEDDRERKRLRRTQCTMKHLGLWYKNNYSCVRNEETVVSQDDEQMNGNEFINNSKVQKRHTLVVILPDFECFAPTVLQDFILILSAHCCQLPFVLIFGVATSVSAVHGTLPYHVTSKIKLRVFQTQPAPVGLNEILDEVLLSPKYSFHLSGKVFKFLTHIFLYYDFSLQGFIQGFKYCLMEHYFQGNVYSLCSSYSYSLTQIKALTHDDMEIIRRQLSFRPYVESIKDCKRIISILTDDNYLKKKLPQLLRDCHLYFIQFRCYIQFLHALIADLPRSPLGKLRRELYVICMSKQITAQAEFKECWQMISFLSKDEFVAKLSKAVESTESFINSEILSLELGEDCAKTVRDKMNRVKELLNKVVAGHGNIHSPPTKTSPEQRKREDALKELSSRHDLKVRLMQMSKKQEKHASEFAIAVQNTLDFIQMEIVTEHLLPLQRSPPLYELFVFSDIATVRRNIIGAPRAALHTALNNPHFYLQCKCCALQEQSQLLSTQPDLSIVYKLHLECGRMINLFDWLQAFRSVVDMTEDGSEQDSQQEQVDPQIQARFTRAVAELQLLGYVKMSKRKTDHVTRLTW